MKGKDEIIGLRIVNIQTAMEVGVLKDIVLDPASKGIAYYVLDEPSDYLGARLINQKYAVGLGDFALTVMGEDIIEGVAHCPWAIELLRDEVKVIGTYALSDKGLLLGVIKQIFFDETTGSIVRCRIQNDEGRTFDIEGTDIVTLGSSFTILLEESALIEVEYIGGQEGDGTQETEVEGGAGADQEGVGTDEMDFGSDSARRRPEKGDLSYEQRGAGEISSAPNRVDLGSKRVEAIGEKKIKEVQDPREVFRAPSKCPSMDNISEARGIGERKGVWRKESVGQEAYRVAQHMSCDAAPNTIRDAACTNYQEGFGQYQEDSMGLEYGDAGRALEISTRPLSAAEAALVKAAEALRRKSAMAAQAKSIEAIHEAEVLKKDNRISKNNQMNEVPSNHVDKIEDTNFNDSMVSSDKENGDNHDNHADVFMNWRTVAKSKVEGLDTDKAAKTNRPENSDKAKDTDESGNMNGAEDKIKDKDKEKGKNRGKEGVKGTKADQGSQETEGATNERRGDGEKLRNADSVRSSKGNGTTGTSLAADEILYPKEFNHFDRRQMQYLLGKRLSQEVRLENGEIMRAGEYITAEMLSLVRTRETLMELTVHIRRS